MIATHSERRGLNGTEKGAMAVLAVVLFFAIQFGAGSGLEYSVLASVYLVCTMFAIRCVGGIRSVFGCVVLWFSLQHVLVSQVMKAVLGEAPESRLLRPIETITSEILLMLGLASAGLVAGLIRPNRDRVFFPPVVDVPTLKRMAGAGFLLSMLRTAILLVAGGGSGASLIATLSIFDSIAVSSAVAVAVTQSGGKRLFSPLVWSVITPLLLFALVGGARVGVATPLASLLLGGWAFGFRYRPWHLGLGVVFGLLMVFIVSPYGLAVRGKARTKNYVRNVNIAADIFVDVIKDPGKYQVSKPEELANVMPETLQQNYFRLPPGNGTNILNRFALIKPNDLIVDVTLKEGTTGWANIAPGLSRLLPSFIGVDKNILATGNMLAHRVPGMVGRDDYTTGITVGLTADSFSAFGYAGAFLMPFGVFLVILVAYKLFLRVNLRQNVYAITVVVPTAYYFSEQPVINSFSIATYSLAIIVFAFIIVGVTVKLLDFRYLRPSRPLDSAPNVDVGARV